MLLIVSALCFLAAVDLCMSLSVWKCTFVLVQITRYQQIIGVHTLQAPTETAKVSVCLLGFYRHRPIVPLSSRSNSKEFFTLRNQPHLRGHKYVINKQRCSNNRRINFFSNRIVNLWNNLPSSTTDFTSFRKFDKSLYNDYLSLYCKLDFA